MKSIIELANDVPKLNNKSKKAIENRTGYPKGLLTKTKEVITESFSEL